jgi:chloramphenicol 3-O-phosphotransferase
MKRVRTLVFYILIFSSIATIVSASNDIIILNGTSSSGKSSIRKELCKILGLNWVSFSIDDYVTKEFIRLYPDALNYSKGIGEEKVDEYIKKFQSSQIGNFLHSNDLFDRIICDMKSCLQQGKNVVIDIVLYGEKYDYILNNLNPYNVNLIMVYCSLPKLIERVTVRNKIARAKGATLEEKLSNRTFARTIRRFTSLYKSTKLNNLLGRITRQDLDIVLKKAELDFDTADMGKNGASNFADFAQALKYELSLIDNEFVYVTPIKRYDMIINNSVDFPCALAQKIVDQLNLSHQKQNQN